MKSIIFVLVALLAYFLVNGAPLPDKNFMRLIAFNETYRVWMTQEEVEEMVKECGAGHHGGFMDITDHPDASPAGLKVAIPLDYPDPTCHRNYILNTLIPQANINTLRDFNNALTAFFNRYYTTATGVSAAQYIYDTFVQNSGGRSDITVSLFQHTWAQPSVIARITGRTLPNEIVIIGAHEDSIASGGANARAPGADDDASGVSTILQIFKILANDPKFLPDRTIEFQTYAAEEVGLRGSDAIAANYQSQQKVVIGMLQQDMTFYTPNGVTQVVGMITDYTNADLTEFVRELVDEYLTIGFVNSRCGYGCSDHASWTKYGYPAAFAFETSFSQSNPYIHTQNDLIQYLNLNHGLQYVRLGLAFITELAFVSCTTP